MPNDKSTEDSRVLHVRRQSRAFKFPEHVPDVLKRFGPVRQSTLRKIIDALDTMAIDYRTARKLPPFKFAEADPKLERFEHYLVKGTKPWNDLRPLHHTFLSMRLKMIKKSERKAKAEAEAATIDFAVAATSLLRIIQKLRDPNKYSAEFRQPHGKSYERIYLWEPLLRLMKKFHVKPGQHGSLSGAIKSLHLSLGIDPPTSAVRKMLNDMKRSGRVDRRDQA